MRRRRVVLLLVLMLTLLMSTACSNNQAKGGLETRQSSIYQIGEVRYCEITADNVAVKSGLGDSFRTVATLHKGDKVRVLRQVGNWYIIRMDNNQLGGIKASAARPVLPEAGQPQPPTETNPVQEPTTPQTPPDTGQTNIDPAKNVTSMESAMVKLVNKERSKNSLNPLAVDLRLTKMARIKAQDMLDNNYFSHYSPTYGSPFDMMQKFNIDYLKAAENLAGNSSVDRAHTALMGSSGHRQNILNPEFTHIGIGIKPSDKYGYIFVQEFIQK